MPKRKDPKIFKWCACDDKRACEHHWNIRLKAYAHGRVVKEERKNLLTSDYGEAATRAREWEGVYARLGREAGQANGTPSVGSGTIEKLCGLDLAEGKSQALSQDALAARVLAYKWIQKHYEANAAPKSLLDYDKCVAFIAARRTGVVGKPSRATTIKRELEILKRLCVIAKRKGWIFELPARWPDSGNDAPKELQRGFFVPKDVLHRWLAELPPDAKEAAMVYAGTGIRAEELPRLSANNISPSYYVFRDAQGNTAAEIVAQLRLEAAGTKTKDERVIPLTREIYQLLVERRKRLPADAPLFGNLEPYRWQWEKASKAIGFHRTIHPRALRHTMATLLAKQSPLAAQAILGHSDLSTTQKYVHAQAEWNAEAMALASGHMAQGTLSEDPVKMLAVGRGGQIRTGDPLTPSREEALSQHLSICKHCQSLVAQHSENEQFIASSGHITGHTLLMRRFSFEARP